MTARQRAEAMEAEAAAWLARQDGGAWDAEDQDGFDRWLAASTAHRVAYLRLRTAWQRADALAAMERPAEPAPALDPAQALPRFSQWRIAAGLLLSCAIGMMIWLPRGGAGTSSYATALGESRQLSLADGSHLTLNTDTRLRVSSASARQVWLDQGEAFFDIAHDPAHPFVIQAGRSRITVLGTRFTVRRDGERTRVLVTQGQVRFSEDGEAVLLLPDQSATASDGHIEQVNLTPAAAAQQLAWRDGRLVLDKLTLAQAAEEFNRYNKRKLVVTDPVAARIVLGGSFAPSNVDGFVRLLESGFGLHAERSGEQIKIFYRGSAEI